MYVEVLVDAGLAGLIAFAWFGCRLLELLMRLVRNAVHGETAMIAAGVTAGTVAIGVHGFVDSFFSFTATYVLFAVTLGLVVGADRLVSAHVHRI
jgi:hypothetical protein